LILLGDPHQLPSINAGSVIRDILASGTPNHYSPAFSYLLYTYTNVEQDIFHSQEKEGMTDCMVEFRQNYRIPQNSPLEYLRQSVLKGDAEESLRLLENTGESLQRIHLPHAQALEACVKEKIEPYLRKYMEYITGRNDLNEIFPVFDSFRVLCAVRAGLCGVDHLNRLMEDFLKNIANIPHHRSLYPGKAIMITENDYGQQLFNGDVGILLYDQKERHHWSFYFRSPDADAPFRKVSPYALPKHEKAFAMTIHKSQGSEYDQVFLFLPHHHSPVLTRELLYTGITRTKRGLVIAASRDIFTASLECRTRRYSGLTEKLTFNAERSLPHGHGN
jgi:exodeoxyribonuclease V alpha subunit